MKYLMSALTGMLVTVGAEALLTKEKLYTDAKKNCHPLNVGNLNKCKEDFELAKVDVKKLKKVDESEGKQIYKTEAKRIIANRKECKLVARAKMQKCAKVYIEGTIKEAVRMKQEKKLTEQKVERKESKAWDSADQKREEVQQVVKNIMEITNGEQLLEVIQQLVKSETAIAAKIEIQAMREQMIQLARSIAKEEATKVARIEAQFVAKEESVRVANAQVVKIQRDNELRLKSQELAKQRAEKERMMNDKAELEQFKVDTKTETFTLVQEEIAKLAESVREAAAEEAIRVATEEAVRVVKAEAHRLSNEQFGKFSSSDQSVIVHEQEEDVMDQVPVVVKIVVETPAKEGKVVEKSTDETHEEVVEKESPSASEETVEVSKKEPVLVDVQIIEMKKTPVLLEIFEQEVNTVKALNLSDQN